MNPEMTQAATEAAARVVSPVRLYRTRQEKSTAINEVLARGPSPVRTGKSTRHAQSAVNCLGRHRKPDPAEDRRGSTLRGAIMRERRDQKVSERRAQMPRAYRATYDRAVGGKSLRAAINSFCLECVCWQIAEVRDCTDLACPLYAVRPYQESAQNAHGGHSAPLEPAKARQRDHGSHTPAAPSDRGRTLVEEADSD
jgi:hypothetical protein